MDEPILNAIVTLRNEVSPWLMILQVVPDGWEIPEYIPGTLYCVGIAWFSIPLCVLLNLR